jgi:hypothetical protein
MIFKEDIRIRIEKDFDSLEIVEAIGLLKEKLYLGDQYLRSLIYLSNGSLENLKKEIEMGDDPRDMIMEAERKSGGFDHWFAIPFDEIEALGEREPFNYEEEYIKFFFDTEQEDNLPF